MLHIQTLHDTLLLCEDKESMIKKCKKSKGTLMDRYLHLFEHAKEEFVSSMSDLFDTLPIDCINIIGDYASSFPNLASHIFYNSLMETAAYNGNIEAFLSVRNRLPPTSMYYDINYINSKGETFLYIAASRGHTNFVKYLLDNGVLDSSDISLNKDMEKTFPLISAVVNGHYNTVVELANSPSIDLHRYIYIYEGKDIDGGNALHWAIHFGHYRIAKYLLSKGLDPNSTNNNGNIFTDAAMLNQPRTLKLLYENPFILKELIHGYNEVGVTPLIRACYYGHNEMVKCLLGYGVDANYRPGNAPSPITWACRNGFIVILKNLISSGGICTVDNIKDSIKYDHSHILKYIIENVEILNLDKDEIMWYAATINNYKAVKILIKYGYDIDFITKGNNTRLNIFGRNKLMNLIIAGCKSAECTMEFLKPKYKININYLEKTLMKRNLAMICLTSYIEHKDHINLFNQLKVILDAGIDTSHRFIFKHGEMYGSLTILDFAILYTHDAIIQLIIPYMDDVDTPCPITGETSLLRAVSSYTSFNVFDALIKRGANIHRKNKLGQNLLVKSIIRESNYFIDYCIKEGVDPNSEFRIYDGGPISIPIMYALEHNSIKKDDSLFNSLFMATKDKYKIFENGYTLFMAANYYKNMFIIENICKKQEINEYLHMLTDNKNNALHYAIKGNYLDGVKYCLEKCNLNPFLKNAENQTAIALSTTLGYDDITSYLFNKVY
jgi:ankyrin repeat protein